MFSSREAFENDFCPVRDELLGEMYRANENGLPIGGERLLRGPGHAGAVLLSQKPSAFAGARDRLELQRTRIDPVGRPRRLRPLCTVPRSLQRARPRHRPPATASRSRCRPSRCPRSRRSKTSSTTKILPTPSRRKSRTCTSSSPATDLAAPAGRALRAMVAFGIAGHAGPAHLGPHLINSARGRYADPARQRRTAIAVAAHPRQSSLTNFSGIGSSAASSSVVKRGQFEE